MLGGEFGRTPPGDFFEFLGHGGVLIGCRLQAYSHLTPGMGQAVIVVQTAKVIDVIDEKQTQSSHVRRLGIWLDRFDPGSEVLAVDAHGNKYTHERSRAPTW